MVTDGKAKCFVSYEHTLTCENGTVRLEAWVSSTVLKVNFKLLFEEVWVLVKRRSHTFILLLPTTIKFSIPRQVQFVHPRCKVMDKVLGSGKCCTRCP